MHSGIYTELHTRTPPRLNETGLSRVTQSRVIRRHALLTMYTRAQNGIVTSGAVAQMGIKTQYKKNETMWVANMRVPKKKTLRYSFFARGMSLDHTAASAQGSPRLVCSSIYSNV